MQSTIDFLELDNKIELSDSAHPLQGVFKTFQVVSRQSPAQYVSTLISAFHKLLELKRGRNEQMRNFAISFEGISNRYFDISQQIATSQTYSMF